MSYNLFYDYFKIYHFNFKELCQLNCMTNYYNLYVTIFDLIIYVQFSNILIIVSLIFFRY